MTTIDDDKEKSKTTEEELLKNKKDNGDDSDEDEDSDDVEALKAQNKKLFNRTKQAEEENKRLKAERDAKGTEKEVTTRKAVKSTAEDGDEPSPEELRLIAKGYSDEDIDKLKVIARGQDISLTEALKDEMFLSFQEKKEEAKKKEKAKLGASKGSAQGDGRQETFKSGMTDEEHKAMFEKEVLGR